MASSAVRPEAGSQVRLQRRTHLAFGGQIENLGWEDGFRSPVIVVGQSKPRRDHGGRSEADGPTGDAIPKPENARRFDRARKDLDCVVAIECRIVFDDGPALTFI